MLFPLFTLNYYFGHMCRPEPAVETCERLDFTISTDRTRQFCTTDSSELHVRTTSMVLS